MTSRGPRLALSAQYTRDKEIQERRLNDKKPMNKNVAWQLAVFDLALVALNFFFHLYISMIGSLLLTLGLSFVSRLAQR